MVMPLSSEMSVLTWQWFKTCSYHVVYDYYVVALVVYRYLVVAVSMYSLSFVLAAPSSGSISTFFNFFACTAYLV